MAGIDQRILQIVIRARQEASKVFEEVETSSQKIGRGMRTAGAAMTGFGVVAGAALLSTLPDYEASKRAEVELQNTISNMPKLQGASVSGFQDLAAAIQSKTAAEDDSVVSGMAMMGTFNTTEKQIQDIMPLVVDYARKFKMDIPKAAIAVGKALDGNIGALKKNGVSIDKAAYKTDAFAAVQKALANQVGGFAEQEAASGIVATEQLANTFGDMKEIVGKVVSEAVVPLIKNVGTFLTDLQKNHPNLVKTIAQFAIMATVGALIIGPVLMLIGFLPLLAGGFGMVGGAVTVMMGPVGLVILAIMAIVGAAYLIYKNWGAIKKWFTGLWNGVKDVFWKAFEAIKKLVIGYLKIMTAPIRIYLKIWKTIFAVALAVIFTVVKFWWNYFGKYIWGAIKAMTKIVVTGWNALKGFAGKAWKAIMDAVIKPVAGAAGAMYKAASAVVIGLWNGLKSKAKWLYDKVIGWVKSVLPDPIIKALGIASPSKVAFWAASMVPLGIANALTAGVGIVRSAARALASAADPTGLMGGMIPMPGFAGGLTPSLGGMVRPGSGSRGGASQSQGVATQTVIVQLDGREIARTVAKQGQKQNRSGGR